VSASAKLAELGIELPAVVTPLAPRRPSLLSAHPGRNAAPRTSPSADRISPEGRSGGALHIFDTGTTAGDDTYSLPSGGWKGLGNPPGSKGFKYKGAGSVSDPCKVVLIKVNIVKAVCKGSGVTLDTPVTAPPQRVDAKFSSGTGTSYCAGFGGTEVKNTATILKRKDAPAPSDCFSPSGAFVDSTPLF